jgi:hypothetical protein
MDSITFRWLSLSAPRPVSASKEECKVSVKVFARAWRRKLRSHAILMYMRVQAKKRRAANGPADVHSLQASRFRAGSLEAELEAIASKIPKRDLRRLPRDLASHVDHYSMVRRSDEGIRRYRISHRDPES